MPNRLYITLSKYGDIINMLPLLYLDSKAGNRAGLMVAKEYAGILEGVSYVEPVVFDGHPWELDRANEQAKTLTEDIICTQVNGPPELVAKYSYGPKSLKHSTTESFQKESWRIAGRLTEWRNQPPLVFDKRDRAREAKLLAGWPTKKVILVSCSGSSSPFPYKDLLFELLRMKFKKGYEIVDLADVRAHRIFDLLALFEKAHCLVTDDSAPLHLAYADKELPVVALVNDRPLLWNGSAWRPNHIAHIRYHDFPKRCVEMLRAIEGIGGTAGFGVWKHPRPVTLFHVWNGYEPGDEDRKKTAMKSWQCEYGNMKWFSSVIEPGSIGRDSQHSAIQDTKRFPFVKDALFNACLRAKDDDLICLTRCDTAFRPGLTELLLANAPCYAHRRLVDIETHSPAVDLFCFSKAWWKQHGDEYPQGMVMGQDPYWHSILMQLVKKYGGTELKNVVYRAHAKKVDRNGATAPKYINHNDGLAKTWMATNNILSLIKPVHEQLPCIQINRRALHPFGYNPSIIKFEDRLLMSYRWHDEGNASTTLAMAEFDDKFNVINNKNIEVPNDKFASHEDARLFMYQGKLHMSYVCSTWPENPPKAVVRYGRLEEGSVWRTLDVIQPAHGKNDGSNIQKNWVFFGHGTDLVFFYNSAEVVGNFPLAVGGPALSWPWGIIRGGTTPMPYKDKLITFFHSRLDNEAPPFHWRYAIGARLLKPEPPFATVAISKEPILRASEVCELSAAEKSTCAHFKPNCVLPFGAISVGDGFLVSVGVNDSSCLLVKVNEGDLNL